LSRLGWTSDVCSKCTFGEHNVVRNKHVVSVELVCSKQVYGLNVTQGLYGEFVTTLVYYEDVLYIAEQSLAQRNTLKRSNSLLGRRNFSNTEARNNVYAVCACAVREST